MPIKNSLPIEKNEYKFDKKYPKPELNSNLEKPKKDKKPEEKIKIFV